jgi:hypothetical protein
MPRSSFEQQLPRYTQAQGERRAQLMARIAETAAPRLRIADERELAKIERAANT